MKVMAIAILALMAFSSPALANVHPNVQKARDEMRAVRYDSAIPLLETALASGGNDRNALVDIHKMMGEMLVPMGKIEDAKMHFKEMLVLSPNESFGGMISPKIVDVLDDAKLELGDDKLEVTQTLNSQSRTVIVEVISDPTEQVVGARATFEDSFGSTKRVDVKGAGTLRIDLPNGAKSVNILVIDKYGNQLQTFMLGNVSFADQSTQGAQANVENPGSDFDNPRGSIVKKWWLWGGIAGVAATSGVLFGLKKQSTQDEYDATIADPGFSMDPDLMIRADELSDTGAKQALYSNISFGVAAAATGVAIYFAITGDDSQESSDGFVGPLVHNHGGGVLVQMPF